MRILAIETSCDETAISIISAKDRPSSKWETSGEHIKVLSNNILSQVKLHAKYGGIYPSLAKREHAKNLIPLLKQTLKEADLLEEKKNDDLPSKTYNIKPILEREPELLKQFEEFFQTIETPDINLIAVTHGPGLEPALWVGINFAKALSLVWEKPLIPINHMEGHIFSAMLKKSDDLQPTTYILQPVTFPAIALLISGGHTELVLMKDFFQYEIIGQTRDDAIGEAFDKVARMLGLPYPGGPEISKLAEKIMTQDEFSFPRPMIDSGNFDFSFSGLKTAVLYTIKNLQNISQEQKEKISHEFQEAATDVLVSKTFRAIEKYRIKTILVGGGVSANKRIRNALVEELRTKNPQTPKQSSVLGKQESRIFLAPLELTGDNALMIAVAAFKRFYTEGIKNKNDIVAHSSLRL